MPTTRPRACAVMAADSFAALFDDARTARFAALAEITGDLLVDDVTDPGYAAHLAEAEVVVTSWGAPPFDAALLERMPQLRAIFHAAGSVRHHVGEAVWPTYNNTRMKSGTIHACKAYAGYQKSADGHTYVFSIIINNYYGSQYSLLPKMYRVLNVLK